MENQKPNEHRSIFNKKTLFICFASLCFLFLLFIACLPLFISTSTGNSLALRLLNSRIPGKLEAQSIQLRWFGAQTAEGLVLYDPDAKQVLDCEQLGIDQSLLSLLWEGPKKITIGGLNAQIIPLVEGNNLLSALHPSYASDTKTEKPPLELKNIQARIDLAKNGIETVVQLHGNTQQGDLAGQFDFDIAAKKLDTQKGEIQVNISISHLPVDAIDLLLTLYQSDLEGIAKLALGPELNLKVNNNIQNDKNKISADIESPNLTAHLSGLVLWEQYAVNLQGQTAFASHPEFIEKFLGMFGLQHHFQIQNNGAPTEATLVIQDLLIPLAASSKAKRKINAALTITPFQLKQGENSIKIQNLTAVVTRNSSSQPKFELQGIIHLDENHFLATYLGQDLQFHIDSIIGMGRKAKGQLHPANITLKTDYLQFDAVASLSGNNEILLSGKTTFRDTNEASKPFLKDILGNALDFTVNGSYNVKDHTNGFVDIALNGEGLQAKASILFADKIKLKDPEKPITLHWKMNPQRFKALRKWMLPEAVPERLQLLETMNVTAAIHELDLSYKENNWTKAGLSADLLIDKMHIHDQVYRQKLYFEGLIWHLSTESLSQDIHFNLQAKQMEDRGQLSELKFSGIVENPFTKSGKVNLHDISATLQAKASRLPAGVLVELGRFDPAIAEKLMALLGPKINIDANVRLQKMNGPVKARLSGDNGYFIFDGKIANGMLTLESPLEAVVSATPELGQHVLQHILPLLSGIVGADNSLKITIAPNGFSFPVKAFDNNKVQVGHASIELGIMYLKNDGQLAKILNVFGLNKADQVVVWFTPAYVQVYNGVVKLERTDMLISNTYPIAIWGAVDLPEDRLDMTIGLSAQALKKAFKIPSLDAKYMMTLPLRGRIGKASIDKTKVTTKISALTAQLLGGPPGFVIGTAIQLATNLMEEKVPPPTTNPLPWESNSSQVEYNQQ